MESFKKISVDELNRMSKNTIMEVLGIRITKAEENLLEGEMPVDARTHRSLRNLTRGASVVLAETLGSVGAGCTLQKEHKR